jgi:hypothetical protein
MFRLRNVLNDNPVFSSLMTYHRVCNKGNTTGTTSVAGIVYPSGAHEFILVFIGVLLLFVLLLIFTWPLHYLITSLVS